MTDKKSSKKGHYIFRRYYTAKGGRRVYPKRSKVFKIWIPEE